MGQSVDNDYSRTIGGYCCILVGQSLDNLKTIIGQSLNNHCTVVGKIVGKALNEGWKI